MQAELKKQLLVKLKNIILYIIEPIHFLYQKIIYQGVIKATSPKDYDKTHSIVVFSFLISWNMIVLTRVLNLSFANNFAFWSFLAIALLIYYGIDKLVYDDLIDPNPNIVQSIICFAYITLSFYFFFKI